MNEVAGGSRCPQCNALNAPMAGQCTSCGAALAQTVSPDSGVLRSPIRSQEHFAAPHESPLYYQAPYAAPAPYGTPYPPVQTSQIYPVPQPTQPYEPYNYGPPRGQPAYNEPYSQHPQPYAPQPYPIHMYGPNGVPQPPPYPHYPMVNVNVSPVVNVAMPAQPPPAPPVVLVNTASLAPNMAVRALWFLFVGLWLGLICTVIGWAMCIAVITLPVGLMLLNRLPSIMTLRPPTRSTQVFYAGNVTVVNTNVAPVQHPMWMRALYFLFVGSWLSAVWLVVAWCLVALAPITLGMSLAPAFMMFDRVPQVLTLRIN